MKRAAAFALMLCIALLAVPLLAFAQADAKAPACAWHTQAGTLRWGVTVDPPGAWAGWWCPSGPYTPWTRQVAAVRFDLLGKAAAASAGAAIVAKDHAALVALRDRPVWGADLGPVLDQGWDDITAARPPGPVWIVAPNGVSTTRPAYPITNGVRSTASTGRATVGATCDCAVRSVEGSSSYCATNTERTLVALCRPL